MITERNMVFANPQAYRVFPQIGNPYNTGLVDTAIYTGHLVVTDTSGNTKNFSSTRTIDFTGFQGTIDIDQYTDIGSVKLGRWVIGETDTPDEPADVWRMRVIASDAFNSMPADGIVISNTSDQTYWVGLQAVNEAQQKVVDVPSSYIEDVEKYGGNISMSVTSFTSSIVDSKDVLRLAFTLDKNPDMTIKTATLNVQFRLTKEDCEQLLGNTNMMGWFGSANYSITQLAQPYVAPYTPGWSIGFSMTNQGTAANKITNGIEVLQTGSDPDHDDNNFFGYTDELYEGERFYSATIQVSGLPEGYTIIGIHGWDGVTITQDGEYTLPEFTWTNPSGYPDGTSIPYQDVPSLRFADGTQADIMFDTPITIVITAVQSMEESINEHV